MSHNFTTSPASFTLTSFIVSPFLFPLPFFSLSVPFPCSFFMSLLFYAFKKQKKKKKKKNTTPAEETENSQSGMSTYLSCSCHHFLYFSYCSRYFPPFPSLCHLAFIYSALGTAALLFPLNPPSLHPAPLFFFFMRPV
ncbi:hypothetical protein K457DRAFT_555217 [Linnemannia elongata AG-77]|uniref:Uncharacterized protein n=1 Tax=Linnemannia elongata AG-77 TaxID=1314771 RepID=A0A197JTI7_9FUNG|nr:hypothetical protein K457DRAFT_555217 [Linnemannia elongata AG-77]